MVQVDLNLLLVAREKIGHPSPVLSRARGHRAGRKGSSRRRGRRDRFSARCRRGRGSGNPVSRQLGGLIRSSSRAGIQRDWASADRSHVIVNSCKRLGHIRLVIGRLQRRERFRGSVSERRGALQKGAQRSASSSTRQIRHVQSHLGFLDSLRPDRRHAANFARLCNLGRLVRLRVPFERGILLQRRQVAVQTFLNRRDRRETSGAVLLRFPHRRSRLGGDQLGDSRL